MASADSAFDLEKDPSITPTTHSGHRGAYAQPPANVQPAPASRVGSRLRAFERTLLKYNLEIRGIQRVEEHEKVQIGWFAYVQVFVLWVSVNLAANNITLGMLGPAVYGLGFRDASLCAIFGAFIGCIPVAWIATWGPLSGNRTMVFSRYAMGWWPSKLMVILNIILLLGYSLLDCVVGGQVLSAVSPHGSMSVVVGIIIVAVITWVVTTFGIAVFHYYERFAFIPQLIVFCILYGVAAPHFDITTPSNSPDTRTIIGNRLSFFSICLSAALTYGGLAADFFVYWPTSTSRIGIFTGTLLGLTLSFTFALVLGVGLTSPLNSPNPYGPYSLAWTTSSGGSGSGSLMVAALSPLHNFGSFCSVLLALGLIANTIPPTYSSGIDFQILGRPLQRIPRVVWNTIGVIIYTACALAGRNSLAVIFTNFLALLGYAFAIWFAILLSEFLFFRGASAANYDWRAWDDSLKLPLGIAALTAFLVGWAGAILCMAQVWYIGPLARLVGEYGADMGNYVGFSWAALVYPPLRWWEKRRFGR